MDDVRKPDSQERLSDQKTDPETWRRENLAKIEAWNEWDKDHPLLPDEPPTL